jgi:hypothetical protein
MDVKRPAVNDMNPMNSQTLDISDSIDTSPNESSDINTCGNGFNTSNIRKLALDHKITNTINPQ